MHLELFSPADSDNSISPFNPLASPSHCGSTRPHPRQDELARVINQIRIQPSGRPTSFSQTKSGCAKYSVLSTRRGTFAPSKGLSSSNPMCCSRRSNAGGAQTSREPRNRTTMLSVGTHHAQSGALTQRPSTAFSRRKSNVRSRSKNSIRYDFSFMEKVASPMNLGTKQPLGGKENSGWGLNHHQPGATMQAGTRLGKLIDYFTGKVRVRANARGLVAAEDRRKKLRSIIGRSVPAGDEQRQSTSRTRIHIGREYCV